MPASPVPALTSRRATLAACVVLAALLNAGGLGLAELAGPALPSAAKPKAPPLRARVVIVTAAPPAPAPPPAAPGAAVLAALDTAATPRSDATPPALTASPPDAPASPANAADRPLRLFGFDEVDVAAEPVDDWALDVAALDNAGVTRLVFELLIDERGTIIGCTVLDPTGLDATVRSALEQRLTTTRLRPAERSGQAVASLRRIVMEIDGAS